MRYCSLVALGAATLLTQGCVQNDLSISITGFAALLSGDCIPSPTTTVFSSRGTLDVGVVGLGYQGYFVAPIVQNDLPANPQGGNSIDPNALFVKGFDIKVTSSDPAKPVPSSYQLPRRVLAAGGTLAPGGGSKLALSVEVIPRELAATWAGLPEGQPPSGTPVIASIRVVTIHSSIELVGAYTDFPVDVCNFCLSAPPTGMKCPTAYSPQGYTGPGGCFAQQDTPATCCNDATSGNPVCIPATAPTTSM